MGASYQAGQMAHSFHYFATQQPMSQYAYKMSQIFESKEVLNCQSQMCGSDRTDESHDPRESVSVSIS